MASHRIIFYFKKNKERSHSNEYTFENFICGSHAL